MSHKDLDKLKQPAVLKLAFFTALCERFGYYILAFMLVLFAKSEYNMTDTAAFALFAVMSALTYMTPAIGGYIADNILGVQRSIVLGLAIEGIGLCTLIFSNRLVFPFALALITIGVGLFKTAPSNLMGRSYEEKDPRIDGGFTLYYMGVNIGSFGSSILGGILQRFFGWHIAFFVGGLGILCGLIIYAIFKKTAANLDAPIGHSKLSSRTWAIFIGAVILLSAFCSLLFSHPLINDLLFGIVGIGLCCYYAYEIFKASAQDRLRIIACLIMIIVGMAYFVFYFQINTSMTLFIHRLVNHNIFGMNVPTEAFLGLNPIWVIILGPILAAFYKYIGEKSGQDIAVTTKFAVGLFSVGLCFFVLVAAISFNKANTQVSALWPVGSIGFFTLGEMLVSALGVAMVTRLVPKRLYGITMGTWFFGSALAGLTSGWAASLASVPDTLLEPHAIFAIYNSAFMKFGVAACLISILMFSINSYVKRISNLD